MILCLHLYKIDCDMENKKTLYRDTDNKMLGGVASGLAEYMDWDVTVVRLAFVFCLFAVQGSVLAYIIAWIIVPSKGNTPKPFNIGLLILLILACTLPAIFFMALFSFSMLSLI